MCAGRSIRFLAEIDQKPFVQLQSAHLGVRVELQHHGAAFGNVRVKLVVPATEERIRDIQSFAVETQLQHLRTAAWGGAIDPGCPAEQPADPNSASEFWF